MKKLKNILHDLVADAMNRCHLPSELVGEAEADILDWVKGLVPEKEELKCKHPERSPSYYWSTVGYNDAIDTINRAIEEER